MNIKFLKLAGHNFKDRFFPEIYPTGKIKGQNTCLCLCLCVMLRAYVA